MEEAIGVKAGAAAREGRDPATGIQLKRNLLKNW